MKELLIWEEDGELKYREFESVGPITNFVEQKWIGLKPVIWNFNLSGEDWYSNINYYEYTHLVLRPVDPAEVPANIRTLALLFT